MISPWKDRDAFYRADKYTYSVYQEMLKLLSEYLNNVHNTNHSLRFWQIIIGPWLFHFIEAFYDRYICLEKAFQENKELRTIVLDEESFYTPRNFKEFADLYAGDFYNLQFYSQILNTLGFTFDSKSYPQSSFSNLSSPNAKQGKGMPKVKSVLKCMLSFYLLHFIPHGSIFLCNPYSVKKYMWRYLWKSRFEALPIDSSCLIPKIYHVNNDKKRLAFHKLDGKDKFMQILIASLPVNFPTLYLEGFKDFSERTLRFWKYFPKVLFFIDGWWFNESLKFFTAYAIENGTKLCICQHGGLYGIAKWFSPETYEVDISDVFFSWGWKSNSYEKIRPLPNPKISALKQKQLKKTSSKKILFVGTAHPRYLYRFFSCPVSDKFEQYLQWRNMFIRFLSSRLLANLVVRLYPIDYGQNQKERLSEEFPELQFDDYKHNFLWWLDRVKAVVIDHPVTTMLETLARNVPTILFWDPQHWELRKEAEPAFEQLANVGIWHKTPEKAAQFLNEVEADSFSWWHNPETQAAREFFISRYAYGSKEWLQKWWFEMQKIMKA